MLTTRNKKMSLTVEKIHQVADQLVDQGINPTQTKVREVLGGGSYSTIGEALKSWKDEQKEYEQFKQTDMPDALKSEGTVYLAKVWQLADQIANSKLASAHEALEAARADSEAEVAEAQEAVKTLEQEQDEIKSQLIFMTDRSHKATADAEQYSIERDALSKQLTDTQHKLELQQERTDAAVATSKELNIKLDEIREKLDEANNKYTQSSNLASSFKAANGMQESEIARLKSELIKHDEQQQKTSSQLTERTAERDSLNKALSASDAKLEAATAQIEQLSAEREQLISENKALAITVTKLESNNERLTQDYVKLNADK